MCVKGCVVCKIRYQYVRNVSCYSSFGRRRRIVKMSMPLMPSERLCLKRTRHKLIQTMDVATILPPLRAANHFTVQEEQTIMADPRRRDRVAMFLDMVAQKGTETFKAFSNVLADQSPHLYLTMSEWDKEDSFDSGPSGKSCKLLRYCETVEFRCVGGGYV